MRLPLGAKGRTGRLRDGYIGLMMRVDRLRGALADLEILDDGGGESAHGNVAEEDRLAREVGARARPPLYRLWENGPALVVTAREARLPSFERAREVLMAEGWPVVERESGGAAVPHGPGILQASLMVPQDRLEAHALEAVYLALCEPVRRALLSFGVETGYGEVEGAFCDGRFNLVTRGRKIAGTSQRWRGGLPPSGRPDGYVLAHMVLFVEADMTRMTEVVNRFYVLAGGEARFDPTAMISVAAAVDAEASGTGQGLTDRVRRAIAATAAAPPAFRIGADRASAEGPPS